MLSPADRVVMISGANRGIGRAIARLLLARGYRISLGARDPKLAAKAVADLANGGLDGRHVLTHAYDALDRGTSERWVEATLQRFGGIDAVVNNAGMSLPVGIEDDDEEAYDRLWQVNVKAPLRLIRLALPHLKRSGAGRIVNVASLSGKRVKNLHAGYAMSKFAVVALTHAVRRVGWEHGVRATALCPSFVATDMTLYTQAVARADMIQPEDLAELVATVIQLPNNAAVAELLVNCRLEDTL